MPDITVPVPDERVADFYSFFGRWLAGGLAETAVTGQVEAGLPAAGGPLKDWGDTEEDLADAVTLWRKYSPAARAVFSLLIDNPDRRFTGDEVAEACGVPNGSRGVAGVLAWPARHGAPLGRWMPASYAEDSETQQGVYWSSGVKAELFKAARAKVEG